jgi:molecular chaperone GrpE
MNSSDDAKADREPAVETDEAAADAVEVTEDHPESAEPATESAEEVEPAEDAAETDPMATLEQDVLKWKELAMRTAADMENFRKRASRDREESVRYANQSLLEELLPIMDNFEMGMQAAGQEKDSMIYIGMDMVRKQLNEFLGNQGVEEIEAEGHEFDPNLHDAVSQEAGGEEGKVLRVTRRGFMLRDRLLRPASVVVATGESSEEESEPEGEG